MKITNIHLTDVQDFELLSAKLVLHGTALLVTRASVASFLLYGHEDVLALEQNVTLEEINQTKSTMNEIIEDESRHIETVLVIFPEGVVCTADFKSDAFPVQDMEVDYAQRELRKRQNHHWPGYWRLRIISTKKLKTKLQSRKKKTLLEAMAGMKL